MQVLQVCATISGLCGARDWTQGFARAKQALCQVSDAPSPIFVSWTYLLNLSNSLYETHHSQMLLDDGSFAIHGRIRLPQPLGKMFI